MSYMMYRETTLGIALSQTLEELVNESLISRALASKVLDIFDRNINKALAHKVKSKIYFNSERLLAYRYCDNVWTFIMKDIEIHEVCWPLELKASKIKIVACEAQKLPPTLNDTTEDSTEM